MILSKWVIYSRWWFQIFFWFSSRTLEKIPYFEEHIFQSCWNHQLDYDAWRGTTFSYPPFPYHWVGQIQERCHFRCQRIHNSIHPESPNCQHFFNMLVSEPPFLLMETYGVLMIQSQGWEGSISSVISFWSSSSLTAECSLEALGESRRADKSWILDNGTWYPCAQAASGGDHIFVLSCGCWDLMTSTSSCQIFFLAIYGIPRNRQETTLASSCLEHEWPSGYVAGFWFKEINTAYLSSTATSFPLVQLESAHIERSSRSSHVQRLCCYAQQQFSLIPISNLQNPGDTWIANKPGRSQIRTQTKKGMWVCWPFSSSTFGFDFSEAVYRSRPKPRLLDSLRPLGFSQGSL